MYFQILNKIDEIYLTEDIDQAFMTVISMLNISLQKGEIDCDDYARAREYNRDCYAYHRFE